MKKLIILIIIFLNFCLVGCKKSVKYDINESFCIGTRETNGGIRKSLFEIIGSNGCCFFKDYEELEIFLNQYDLMINGELESKYNTDFFNNNYLIIFFSTDSSSGYKYKFNLYLEDNILKLEVKKSRNDKYNHLDVEKERLFFIDVKKNNNENIIDFELLHMKG